MIHKVMMLVWGVDSFHGRLIDPLIIRRRRQQPGDHGGIVRSMIIEFEAHHWGTIINL